MNITETLEQIKSAKVLVIGDLMLDRYWWGTVDRVSPEAPVPVVAMNRENLVLGGAANVAANVVGLGASVSLCGVIGDNAPGDAILSALLSSGISSAGVMKVANRPTTVKTRILAHNQQVARIDQETSSPLNSTDQARFLETVLPLIDEFDVVVFSDYNKGLLSPALLGAVISRTSESGRKVLVDPKGKDFTKYRGATILTPNLREAIEATGLEASDEDSLTAAASRLIADLDLASLLVTRGEHGMLLLMKDGGRFTLNATARDVYDVTGAGDTVIATLSCGVAAGLELEAAVTFANHAAGIVIQHLGTTAITREMLLS